MEGEESSFLFLWEESTRLDPKMFNAWVERIVWSFYGHFYLAHFHCRDGDGDVMDA